MPAKRNRLSTTLAEANYRRLVKMAKDHGVTISGMLDRLVEQASIDSRLDAIEGELKEVIDRLARLEEMSRGDGDG